MLSNTLRLNFVYFKITHILHLGYHRKIIGHILIENMNMPYENPNEKEYENEKKDHIDAT